MQQIPTTPPHGKTSGEIETRLAKLGTISVEIQALETEWIEVLSELS